MKSLFTVLLLSISAVGFGQGSKAASTIKILKAGDKIPDVIFDKILNYDSKDKSLSGFRKGKLLLLDLWFTGCASCIESFPKIQKLQEQFSGKMKVLLVNNVETEKQYQPFLQKQKRLGKGDNNLPMVFNNKLLKAWFKTIYYPEYILIDSKGVILGFPLTDQLDAENIQAILDGKPVSMAKEMSEMMEIAFYSPLFIKGNGGNGERIMWHSTFSKYVEGIPSTQEVFTHDSLYSGVFALNSTIQMMFQMAYSNKAKDYIDFLPYQRVILNVWDLSTEE
jgi:thiol-disulfide isomerase/thioredoxin